MAHPPASHGYQRVHNDNSANESVRKRMVAAVRRADYTLLHAGRQLRLGPIAFWVVVGTVVIMAAWTITTATYFAFREDVLTRLIARQAEMQFGYEDRIAELRAQVDRISSRQLLDQEQYEQKLDQILRRQTTLESRASALNGLPDGAATGSLKPPARNATPSDPARTGSFKPSPINDTSLREPPAEREARLNALIPALFAGKAATNGIDATLRRLQASLDRVEARQSNALVSIEESYEARSRRIRSVLADVGVDANKAGGHAASGIGGPFVAARPPADANGFDRQVHRVSLARAQLDRLTRAVASVPLRRPVMGEVDPASSFGVRIDPFLRSPAMHTGLDLRADTGEPVRATANGTVSVAGWNGGYGKLVEIDHGNGFATRYGHLSAIDVHVGQSIKIGQIVGKVGSTGRSTGPHLHYETRVEGEAVDPQKFLRAGSKLGSLN
jgi:murein DD-endopeptidase MepM/ murein hydrolase activator NlpD